MTSKISTLKSLINEHARLRVILSTNPPCSFIKDFRVFEMEKEYVVISVKNDDLIAHENKSVKAIFTLEITFEDVNPNWHEL